MVERLDPEMAAAMARHDELRRAHPLPEKPTIDDIKAQAIATRLPFNTAPPDLYDVADATIAGPLRDVPIRRYQPTKAAAGGPAILYIHGGGWFSCSLDTHDWAMRRLALDSGFVVIGIDPAQAPAFKFPKPLDEVTAVFRRVAESGDRLDIDAGRLAFAGCSSGANLALGAALNLQGDFLRAGALFYGSFGLGKETESLRAYGDGRFGIGTRELAWTRKTYLNEPEERSDPRAAPLFAGRSALSRLPPLFLAAAELDPLRDDTLELAGRLAECKVMCTARIYDGLAHSFLVYASMVDAARTCLQDAAEHIRQHLAEPVAGVSAKIAEGMQNVR